MARGTTAGLQIKRLVVRARHCPENYGVLRPVIFRALVFAGSAGNFAALSRGQAKARRDWGRGAAIARPSADGCQHNPFPDYSRIEADIRVLEVNLLRSSEPR